MAQECFSPHKEAKTFAEQLQLLESRGLIIENYDDAIKILTRVNYYKLSGYSLHMRKKDYFFDGISFEMIYDTYLFDKRLSSILLDLFESVEVTFKTQVAYHIAHEMGPVGYLDSCNFNNQSFHATFLSAYHKEKARRLKHQVKFVEHNINKYGDLPIWIAIEILSLGTISMLYSNMLQDDQNTISKNTFAIKSHYLVPWMERITDIRNRCAHHSRHYNRSIPKAVPLFTRDKQHSIDPSSLFAVFLILKRLILKEEQWCRVLLELESLFLEFSDSVDISRIGFPHNWKDILLKT